MVPHHCYNPPEDSQSVTRGHARVVQLRENFAVAARANMNPQAFSRYFRKTTFKRFIDDVNEMRIGKACRLLIDTDKTVAEICFQSGFHNLSNFNRQVHKVQTVI
jgi:AraC-like DNA-binding protein